MRNSEVYAYIERLFDASNSGITDSASLTEVIKIVMDMEEEVSKQMKAEEKLKSGIESNSFFNELAVSTDEEIIEFCERMEQIHPALGKFAEYLMEEDDPTFFIAYGDKPKLTGRSSDEWGYYASLLLFKYFMRNCQRGDSDDK
jgi:hypothetical protein